MISQTPADRLVVLCDMRAELRDVQAQQGTLP
jgi:hypothetical protein